jgi:acyl-CoA synthetase (NDP forming)
MDRKELLSKLDKMFFPQSVAVVGASDVPGKWGNSILTAILGWSYRGQVYLVNPNKKSILNIECYPNLRAIPGEVDLALFTIPARMIPDGFRDCIAKGIQTAVVISAGFKETGEEGTRLEKEIVMIAREGGLVFIGPNTMGIASAHHYFDAVFTPTAPRPGGLAIISQSGNLGIQIMKWTHHKDIGLSIYAGTGNEAMLTSSDLLMYMGSRDEVKAVAMYIEGIPNGREFMEIAAEVTRKKPVVAIKAGRSSSGSKAAQSHTGSMAGSFATYKAMFAQAGIIQVNTPLELLNVAAAMTHLPIPMSNRVGVMTFGGGWGIIAADECEDSGLVLPQLTPEIIHDLDGYLPDYWNRRNPVDVVAESDPDLYLHIIGALARWDATAVVIALGIVGRSRFVEDFIESQERLDGRIFSRELKLSILRDQIRSEERIISGIGKIQKETGKPILVVALAEGGLTMKYTDYGPVIILSSPEEVVSIISHMVHYGKFLAESKG